MIQDISKNLKKYIFEMFFCWFHAKEFLKQSLYCLHCTIIFVSILLYLYYDLFKDLYTFVPYFSTIITFWNIFAFITAFWFCYCPNMVHVLHFFRSLMQKLWLHWGGLNVKPFKSCWQKFPDQTVEVSQSLPISSPNSLSYLEVFFLAVVDLLSREIPQISKINVALSCWSMHYII